MAQKAKPRMQITRFYDLETPPPKLAWPSYDPTPETETLLDRMQEWFNGMWRDKYQRREPETVIHRVTTQHMMLAMRLRAGDAWVHGPQGEVFFGALWREPSLDFVFVATAAALKTTKQRIQCLTPRRLGATLREARDFVHEPEAAAEVYSHVVTGKTERRGVVAALVGGGRELYLKADKDNPSGALWLLERVEREWRAEAGDADQLAKVVEATRRPDTYRVKQLHLRFVFLAARAQSAPTRPASTARERKPEGGAPAAARPRPDRRSFEAIRRRRSLVRHRWRECEPLDRKTAR